MPGFPSKSIGDDCAQLGVKKKNYTNTTSKLLLDWWKQMLTGMTKARTKYKLNFLPDQRGGKRTLLQLPPHSEDKIHSDQGITTSFPPAESTPGHNITAVPWHSERAKLLPLALLSRQWVSDFRGRRAEGTGALSALAPCLPNLPCSGFHTALLMRLLLRQLLMRS